MTARHRPRPLVLCILDGWGQRAERRDNGIVLAHTPTWNHLLATCPHALLQASERHVGLPAGQMGNSEVGHMNLGAGRVVMQDLPRIDEAVADGSLAANPALRDFIAALQQSKGRAHLMGLLSPGGVHAHQDHLIALARIVAAAGINVVLHPFLDGRDTPPQSADGYLAALEAALSTIPGASIGTVMGRFYPMDRDKRWPRVALAYAALVDGQGEAAPDARTALAAAYATAVTDEFVKPTVLSAYRGMNDGDGLLCGNFRADRVREILGALVDPGFDGFARGRVVAFAACAGLTEYADDLNRFMSTLFAPEDIDQTFGETVARAGLTQLRIAETEKYAHVTFFFNGGREIAFDGEQRILIPSPKVATYDLQPEMSAAEVTDRLVATVEAGETDVIIVNFANTDMVGHTGDLPAAIRAVQAVDLCLGRLVDAVTRAGGTLLVTADHGNAEMMRDPVTGQPHTAHTLNPVPIVLVNAPAGIVGLEDGRLADVAPTLLDLIGLAQPAAMTGRSLARRSAMAVTTPVLQRAAG